MENIHIIPTNKLSRLQRCASSEWFDISKENLIDDRWKYQNIYITNDEKIKDGDWAITNNGLLAKVVTELTWHFINSKKIILTNDIDLIADGIQAIDDVFLEWFVKNPSCEQIEIFYSKWYLDGKMKDYYKALIPKKEKCICENPTDNTCNYCNELERKQILLKAELNAKQETLEEAAENYVKEKWEYTADENKESFINGAKWQQKRSYNKEEVKQAYVEGGFALMRYNDGLKYIDVNDWFKQFKKEVRL